jgi:hypothetical protein
MSCLPLLEIRGCLAGPSSTRDDQEYPLSQGRADKIVSERATQLVKSINNYDQPFVLG